LLDLGLEPHLLTEATVQSMLAVIQRYADRALTDAIPPRTPWRSDAVLA
jgi:hypothetical protein